VKSRLPITYHQASLQETKFSVSTQAGQHVLLDSLDLVHVTERLRKLSAKLSGLEGQDEGAIHYPALLLVAQSRVYLAAGRTRKSQGAKK
jgi:hypothetical protein